MKRKVAVTVDGREYILTSADNNAQYMEQVADYVNDRVQTIRTAVRVSSIDAATMAALDVADNYFKERTAAENLRSQLKAALDESTKLKKEISDLKMENFRLSQKR